MKDFEKNIINELLQAAKLIDIDLSNTNETIEYSGSGYFITIKDPTLPKQRIVLDIPKLNGMLGNIEVGYLAFIENSEILLECYSLDKEVTPNHREQEFVRTAT